MVNIHQGDQYYLPIEITRGQTPITPDMVDDVRIKLGGVLKYYSTGEIIFDTETNKYKYPLTEEETKNLLGQSSIQIGLKIGNDIINSNTENIRVAHSIITEEW